MTDQNTPNEDPHVQIFGHDVEDNHGNDGRGKERWHRHHRHGGWGFGLILIFIGAVLLFNNLGLLPWAVWNFIWPLWPLLLVLIGLRILFGRGWLGNLIVLIAALAVIAFVLFNALERVNSPWMQYFHGRQIYINDQIQ